MSKKQAIYQRGRMSDATEQWLAEHDPKYKERDWETPRSDALDRTLPFDDRDEGGYPVTMFYRTEDYNKRAGGRADVSPKKRERAPHWLDEARRLIANGYGLREAARRVGVSHEWLRQKLQENQS